MGPKSLAVMQAANEGKAIEFRATFQASSFCTMPSDFNFDWVRYDYRVKEEPKVLYANEYPSLVCSYYSKEEAIAKVGKQYPPLRVAVEYREVVK
jgi:hypothetical protein